MLSKEEKELLLKDLCARLPYGVKVECKWKTPAPNGTYGMVCTLDSFLLDQIYNVDDVDVPFDEFKPYLFPLSSMTEEQFAELKVFADLTDEGNTLELVEWNYNYKTLEFWLEEIPSYCVIKVFDWLNKNHFDYRDLIPKGLANDATGLNVY